MICAVLLLTVYHYLRLRCTLQNVDTCRMVVREADDTVEARYSTLHLALSPD